MSALLQDLLAFGTAHPHSVGLIAFAAAFLESLAVVGTLVPGGSVLIALGALVPLGVDPLPLVLWGVAGAVAGDGLSYWLGHRYRGHLRSWPPLARNAELLDRGERFFLRHGAKSVIFARFVGIFRAVVPLIAGMAGMPPLRFAAVNLLSASLWVPAMMLPGVLFGSALGLAASVSMRLVVLCLLLLLVILAVAWSLRLLLRHAVPALVRGLDGLQRWAQAGRSAPRRLVLALLAPAQGELSFIALLGVLALAALWAFLAIVEDVLTGDPLVAAGEAVFNLMQELRTPWGDHVMITMTALGDGIVVTAVTIAAVAWLVWRRAWWAAACFGSAVLLTALFVRLLKVLLHLPRPLEDLYSGWSAFSFPSGHAATNAAVYGMLMLLLLRELSPRWGVALVAVLGAFVGLIGLSRLYLGAHWLPDVLAGFVFAANWVALFAAAYHQRARERLGARGLLASAFAGLVVVGGWNATENYDRLVLRYAVQVQPQILSAAAWWADDWRRLPDRRIDLKGESEELFSLQWAGEPMALEVALRTAGWHRPPIWTVKSALAWLAPTPDPELLPTLPKLSDGRRPLLTLVRSDESAPPSRLVLRLWHSGAVLEESSGAVVPILLGSVARERIVSLLGIVPLSHAGPYAAAAELARLLPEARLVARSTASGEATAGTLLAHDGALHL